MSNLRRVPYTKPIPPGAEVFTRKEERFARFKDRRGKTVEAPLTEDGTRIRLLSKKWYGEYTDADGRPQCVPLATDRTAAEQMLAALVRKAELGKAGVVDPFEEHRKRPLAEHLDDFERALLAKGTGKRHVEEVKARIRRILDGCRFVFLSDLSASRVQEFLADLRNAGRSLPPLDPSKDSYTPAELAAALQNTPASASALVRRHRLETTGTGKGRRYPRATAEALHALLTRGPGPATVNAYVRAIRSFTRWLVRDRRAGDNPLAGLSGVSTAGDVRRDRRALPPEELGMVLQAALVSGTTFRGLSGRDRHFLYLTACGTGFRAGELSSLTPESFALDATPPTATVPAGYTKNKRLAVQPLPAEVAEALRGYLSDRPAGQPVWGGTWAAAREGAKMLRIDLDAAGIPYAVEGPDGPLYADFHALRHSYVALLDRAGLTLKQAMQLARHSDPRLTMARYGRAQLHDLGAAVHDLPSLLPSGKPGAAGVLAATGTTGTGESFRQACAGGDAGRGVLRIADEGEGESVETVVVPNPLAGKGVEDRGGPVMSDDDGPGSEARTGPVPFRRQA